MSRVYDALRQMEKDQKPPGAGQSTVQQPDQPLGNVLAGQFELAESCSVKTSVSERSHLAALTDPHGLGAEKFRALATRLDNLRRQKEVKSLQVTSSLSMEGKSFVAANLAVTFAKRSGTRVLLLEGDLHKPVLSSLFGLSGLRGISHWWAGEERDILRCLYKLDDMPLWFLSAGSSDGQPSHLLQSARFAEAFQRLSGLFDWIVVDSTPMSPIADANLWSQLLDGTLLVVREGVASVDALAKGLKSLDNPNLIGVVLNDASESARADYANHYYGSESGIHRKPRGKR